MSTKISKAVNVDVQVANTATKKQMETYEFVIDEITKKVEQLKIGEWGGTETYVGKNPTDNYLHTTFFFILADSANEAEKVMNEIIAANKLENLCRVMVSQYIVEIPNFPSHTISNNDWDYTKFLS